MNIAKEKLSEIMDMELPPRIPQNIHGYFHLGSQRKQHHVQDYNHSKLPTRLDLCNHWDAKTVSLSKFLTEEGPKEGSFVFFYAIDCKTTSTSSQVKPVEISPKPRAIKATYNVGKLCQTMISVKHVLLVNDLNLFARRKQDITYRRN